MKHHCIKHTSGLLNISHVNRKKKKDKQYQGPLEDSDSDHSRRKQPLSCFKEIISTNNKLSGQGDTVIADSFSPSGRVPETLLLGGLTLLPTFDQLRPVCLPQLLQEAVVEALCLLRGHCQMKVRLVALEDALEGELANAEHLVLFVHHTLRPVFPALILKHTQVQNLSDPTRKTVGRAT